MGLVISKEKLNAIHQNGEQAYPEEGAGLMLGRFAGDEKQVETILPLTNTREDTDRHNRYLLDPQDYLKGEMEAARLGLDVLGVFHSHPDHPSRPSEFDREWAIPWFSYVITSIQQGKAVESRSWLLAEDRSTFLEETIEVKD
jgi:proteasome lid subunit RPN8/RPN11